MLKEFALTTADVIAWIIDYDADGTRHLAFAVSGWDV
jgi:hypothetical protein